MPICILAARKTTDHDTSQNPHAATYPGQETGTQVFADVGRDYRAADHNTVRSIFLSSTLYAKCSSTPLTNHFAIGRPYGRLTLKLNDSIPMACYHLIG